MKNFETKKSLCISCHNFVDGAIGIHAPRENDISVCVYCGNVAKFDKNLALTELTEEERPEILEIETEFEGKIYKLRELSKRVKDLREMGAFEDSLYN